MRSFVVWLFFFSVFGSSATRAQLVVNADAREVSLAGQFAFLDDPSGALTLAEVLTRADQFQSLPGFLNRGYTQAATWLRLDVHNPAPTSRAVLVRLSPPTLDELDVYVEPDPPERMVPGGWVRYSLGDHAPMAGKPIPGALPSFPLSLEPQSHVRVYLRIRSKGAHALRAELDAPEQAQATSLWHAALQSGHIGMAAVLAIVNFLLALRLRDRVYALYGGYLLTLALGGLGIDHLIGVLWPAIAHLLADGLTAIGTGLGFTFMCWFVMAVTKTRANHPWCHRYLLAISVLGVLVFAATGSSAYGLLTQLLVINGPILTSLLVWLPLQMIKRGEVASGRLIFLAFVLSAVGATVTFLRLLGILPINDFTQYALQVSSVAHMLVMMMGLSERVLAAEAAALQSARAAETTARQLASEMTQDLIQSKAQVEQALGREQLMRAEQTRFIDLISHEYRTPLSILRTHLDVISARDLLDEKRLTPMRSAVKRLQSIFSNALHAHRIGRPPPPRMEEIDLAILCRETIFDFENTHPNCLVDFMPGGDSYRVLGDRDLLSTALRNLLDNARKYRDPAQPDCPVTCRLCASVGKVQICVANAKNPAIVGDSQQLFERFVRGPSAAGQSGMGIGLYLVRHILHDHQGTALISNGPPDRFEICLELPGLPSLP